VIWGYLFAGLLHELLHEIPDCPILPNEASAKPVHEVSLRQLTRGEPEKYIHGFGWFGLFQSIPVSLDDSMGPTMRLALPRSRHTTNHDLSLRVSFLEVPKGLGNVAQLVAAIDHGRNFASYQEIP